MKILLTGACGIIGRAIMSAAAGEHEIVAFDMADQVNALGGVQASVTDRDAIMRAAEGCEAVIHTAAMHGASHGKASNQQFLHTNLIGAENIFEAAIHHGIRRLVFSSTYEVLCGMTWAAAGMTVLDHNSPPRPDWIYPVTKLMVEDLGHFHSREHGLEIVQLRYVYVRDLPIDQIGLGLLSRCITDTDVADANLLSCVTPGLRDEVFLIGPDTPLTIQDVMQARSDPWAVLEKHWPGCSVVLKRHDQTPQFDHFWPVARIDPAKRILGWQPQSTFENYLRLLGWSPRKATSRRTREERSLT